MKIAILGTRGIPNFHGGFEQFAENLSVFLTLKGHDIVVYSSSNHPYKEKTFKGVKIVHCLDPELKFGTVGQFFYDLNCILDSRKRKFDIILQLGYTSSSIWSFLFPKKAIIITNMDGLEWKRSKYSKPIQIFLKFAEKLAVKKSDYLVSDSLGIQKYLNKEYGIDSTYIAYGASSFTKPNENIIKEYGIVKYKYSLLIARMEPENNIETILDGVVLSDKKQKFLVIGKNGTNKYGKNLTKKYKNNKNIIFLGGIYNQNHLNNIRYYSNLYFHGHSIGGTNPSLLEAMASKALIIAHNNEFNKSILGEDAFYFESCSDIRTLLNNERKKDHEAMLKSNHNKIIELFSKNKINSEYLKLFNKVVNKST